MITRMQTKMKAMERIMEADMTSGMLRVIGGPVSSERHPMHRRDKQRVVMRIMSGGGVMEER